MSTSALRQRLELGALNRLRRNNGVLTVLRSDQTCRALRLALERLARHGDVARESAAGQSITYRLP